MAPGERRNCERTAADEDRCDCAVHVVLRFVQSVAAYVSGLLGWLAREDWDLMVTVERSADDSGGEPDRARLVNAFCDRLSDILGGVREAVVSRALRPSADACGREQHAVRPIPLPTDDPCCCCCCCCEAATPF